MKSKIILGLYALLVALIVSSCQPEEVEKPLFEPVTKPTTLSEEQGLVEALRVFTGDNLSTRDGRTESSELSFGTLDYTEIVKIIATEDQPLPNYTIRLNPPDSIQKTLEYLVLVGEEDGYWGYLLQFEANPEHWATLYDRGHFTGHLRLLDFERRVMADNIFENGVDQGSVEKDVSSGRVSGASGGHSCNCIYGGRTTGFQADGSSTWIIDKTQIICDCEPWSTFQGEGGGGGGGADFGSYPPGQPINVSPGGGGGGVSGGANGGNRSPVDGITPGDAIGTLKPDCTEGYLTEDDRCLDKASLIQSFENLIVDRYDVSFTDFECVQTAVAEFSDALDQRRDLDVAFISGMLSFLRCHTADDPNASPELRFTLGFLNSLVDELDVTMLLQLERILKENLNTKLDCWFGLDFEEMTTMSQDQAFHTFMQCIFGLDVSLSDVQAAMVLAENYARETYTDPYKQGQVSQAIIGIFLPTKWLKLSRFRNILEKAKNLRKLHELLQDINKRRGSLSDLQEVLRIHRLRDRIFDTQRDLVERWVNRIGDESTGRKGNFGEMAADTDLVSKGYTPLHTDRIQDIDAPTHQGIDGIFQKDGRYYIVESKYGSSALSNTNDGRQMSDDWINGSNRLNSALDNNVGLAEDIVDQGYQRVLANITADGSIQYFFLDSDGFKIIGPGRIFIP